MGGVMSGCGELFWEADGRSRVAYAGYKGRGGKREAARDPGQDGRMGVLCSTCCAVSVYWGGKVTGSVEQNGGRQVPWEYRGDGIAGGPKGSGGSRATGKILVGWKRVRLCG